MLRKIKMGGAIFILSLLALVGCQSEKLVNDGGSQQGQLVSLTVSKSMGSRTHLVDSNNGVNQKQTVWSENDQIFVSSEDGWVSGVLTLDKEDVGKTEGTFRGLVSGSPSRLAYSVYPYTEDKKLNWNKVEGYGQFNAPMIGKININAATNVQFHHTCGVVAVNVRGAENTLKLSAKTPNGTSIKIGAVADMTFSNIDLSSSVPSFKSLGSSSEYVTIEKPQAGTIYVPYIISEEENPEDLGTVDFYLTYNGSEKKITQKTGEDDLHTYLDLRDYKGLLALNSIAPQTIVNGEFMDETIVKEIDETSQEATIEVDEHEKVVNIPELPKDETGKPTINSLEIEVAAVNNNNETDETPNVVSFDEIPQGVSVTITDQNTTEDDNASIKEMVVIMPSGTSEEEAKESVEINMPNTTVTVKSSDGNTLYVKEMTAATAQNTLVIDYGVTIDHLIAKEGNIEVRGHVKKISIGEGHKYEKGNKKVKVTIGNSGRVDRYSPVDNDPEDDWFEKAQEGIITIQNTGLSTALKELYPNNVNLSSNGYANISESFAKSIRTLNFSDCNSRKQITSLTGIEVFENLTDLSVAYSGLKGELALSSQNFTKLRSLDVSNNNLTSLNVNGISTLTNLMCGYNYELRDNINVTRTNLVEFRYQHTNATQNLVPENLIDQLEIFDCGDNQLIGSLDLSAYTSIKVVHVPQNHGLTSLILPTNNDIETLDITGTGISHIDLTQCPNLHVFYNQGNNFTTLDLSECTEIWLLYTDGNKLTELDLTNNPHVSSLYCGSQQDNRTLTLKLHQDLKARWEDWRTQERVKLYGEEDDEPVVEMVTIENVELSKALEVILSPEVVKLNASGFAEIPQTVTDNQTSLKFSGDIGGITTLSLSELEKFENLSEISIDHTTLQSLTISQLSGLNRIVIEQNENLATINFTENNQSISEIFVNDNEILSSVDFSNIPNLTILNVQSNESLSEITLPENNILTRVSFADNALTNINVNEWSESLQDLDVSENQLTTLDVSNCRELRTLNCQKNYLTDLILSTSSDFSELDCSSNKLTSLDISNIPNLIKWSCGNQTNDNENWITLTMTEGQKNLYNESDWATGASNANVKLNVVSTDEDTTAGVTNGNTSGEGFKNGGEF